MPFDTQTTDTRLPDAEPLHPPKAGCQRAADIEGKPV